MSRYARLTRASPGTTAGLRACGRSGGSGRAERTPAESPQPVQVPSIATRDRRDHRDRLAPFGDGDPPPALDLPQNRAQLRLRFVDRIHLRHWWTVSATWSFWSSCVGDADAHGFPGRGHHPGPTTLELASVSPPSGMRTYQLISDRTRWVRRWKTTWWVTPCGSDRLCGRRIARTQARIDVTPQYPP